MSLSPVFESHPRTSVPESVRRTDPRSGRRVGFLGFDLCTLSSFRYRVPQTSGSTQVTGPGTMDGHSGTRSVTRCNFESKRKLFSSRNLDY